MKRNAQWLIWRLHFAARVLANFLCDFFFPLNLISLKSWTTDIFLTCKSEVKYRALSEGNRASLQPPCLLPLASRGLLQEHMTSWVYQDQGVMSKIGCWELLFLRIMIPLGLGNSQRETYLHCLVWFCSYRHPGHRKTVQSC